MSFREVSDKLVGVVVLGTTTFVLQLLQKVVDVVRSIFVVRCLSADIGWSARSGCGYSAGWSDNVFAGRATPEVDGLDSMSFVRFAPRLYARYFASVASSIFSPLTVSLWVIPMCRARFDFCPYSFAHFGQRCIFRATGSFGERTRRALFFTLATVRCELVANFWSNDDASSESKDIHCLLSPVG